MSGEKSFDPGRAIALINASQQALADANEAVYLANRAYEAARAAQKAADANHKAVTELINALLASGVVKNGSPT